MQDAPSVFASLFAYAAVKHAGDRWPEVQRGYRADPSACPWVGFLTLAHAEALSGERVLSYIDGGTYITKARSRASGIFLASGADVWLSIDDDTLVEREGLARLVEAARALRGVAVAPCALRGAPDRIDVVLVDGFERKTLTPISRWGMGACAMHVDAILAVSELVPYVSEPPGYPACFLETVEGGAWCGDDYAFAMRCERAGVPAVAVAGICTKHAGTPYTFTT